MGYERVAVRVCEAWSSVPFGLSLSCPSMLSSSFSVSSSLVVTSLCSLQDYVFKSTIWLRSLESYRKHQKSSKNTFHVSSCDLVNMETISASDYLPHTPRAIPMRPLLGMDFRHQWASVFVWGTVLQWSAEQRCCSMGSEAAELLSCLRLHHVEAQEGWLFITILYWPMV